VYLNVQVNEFCIKYPNWSYFCCSIDNDTNRVDLSFLQKHTGIPECIPADKQATLPKRTKAHKRKSETSSEESESKRRRVTDSGSTWEQTTFDATEVRVSFRFSSPVKLFGMVAKRCRGQTNPQLEREFKFEMNFYRWNWIWKKLNWNLIIGVGAGIGIDWLEWNWS